MDCEKFEPLLLDELYEELDELTSAAVKRHVSGCARCAAILGGMTSTRKAISLPIVPVPVGLEDRILAAAKEAQKVVPIRSRLSRALAIGGSWAMRPQTAMAAVFLLMIGTSAFLIRSNRSMSPAAVSVTVEGSPAPTLAATSPTEALDDKAAAAAHGPTPPVITRPPAVVVASAVALGEERGNGPLDRLTGGAAHEKEKAADEASLASAFDPAGGGKDTQRNAPAATAAAPPITNAGGPLAGAGGGSAADLSQSPAQPYATKRAGPAGQDPFSLGAAAFRTRNFAEATRQFDLAAQGGDTNAALWAAESVREGQGCAVAVGRFDQLARRAAGSWAGDEAQLRAARCEIAMGTGLDSARARLDKLAQSSTHQQAAQNALSELNAVAARKAGGTGGSGAAAAAAPKPRAAAPAKAPAASPVRAPEAQEQKKSLDANGF